MVLQQKMDKNQNSEKFQNEKLYKRSGCDKIMNNKNFIEKPKKNAM